MPSSDYKYFLYSVKQLNDRTTLELKMGKRFKPGSVIYHGRRRAFTEVSSKPTSEYYTDAKVVAEGTSEEWKISSYPMST